MPMSYSTAPNRAGGQATCAEPTPTQGMGGWEAVLSACLKELVQKWAKSLGVRTTCSNTDAGPAVPVVSLLLRYISTKFRRYTCATVDEHFRAVSLAQTKQSESPNRIAMAY